MSEETDIRLRPPVGTDAQAFYEDIDRLDETMITQELQGAVIDEFFYEFDIGGKKVIGLSIKGVEHVARRLAEQGRAVSVDTVEVENRENEYFAKAQARDVRTGAAMWGSASCQKVMQLKSGGTRDNTFAETIAISKAQRNAIRHFIPETAIKAGYTAWKAKGKALADAANAGRIG